MRESWMEPPAEEERDTDDAERGRILVDLLLLTDALPPVPRTELAFPTWREICARRR